MYEQSLFQDQILTNFEIKADERYGILVSKIDQTTAWKGLTLPWRLFTTYEL